MNVGLVLTKSGAGFNEDRAGFHDCYDDDGGCPLFVSSNVPIKKFQNRPDNHKSLNKTVQMIRLQTHF